MANNNVLVNNLCKWPLYFKRANGQGDIAIPANAKNYPLLSYDEVQAQIQVGNKLFTGTDNMGNHARIQIADEAQRRQLFGLPDDAPVAIAVTEESVKALLAIRGKVKFRDTLAAMVQTDAEKRMLVDIAFRVGADEAETWKVDALRELAATAGL